jgi:oligopeptide/dipeptide ABC transporter ATP-binding protein
VTPLLRTEDLVKRFTQSRSLGARLAGAPLKQVHAVNGVSLDIAPGETLGLIGESGCGKSTLGRVILRLHEPTSGRIHFEGQDVTRLGPEAMKSMRQKMQIVFQDPYASLNPRRTVEQIVGLPLKLHGITPGRQELPDRVAQMVENVGLKTAHLQRYPHQFSGGQRQRIGIARALVLGPDFIVCDEPVSALDVSIQAQIIQLLADLRRELGLTYLFISHDISVIAYVSDRIAVMYLGKIAELGSVSQVLERPSHPYTQALLSAVPRVDGSGGKRVRLEGDLPSPIDLPKGCYFHTRCPRAEDVCRRVEPPVTELAPGHTSACHFAEDVAKSAVGVL